MDRQQTVEAFRARVLELIDRGNESRSAFYALSAFESTSGGMPSQTTTSRPSA
jgi:hypothetical protein